MRVRIDEIDAALMELMAERFRMVDEVRTIKSAQAAQAGSPMRPVREVSLMRRLMALRRPELPAPVVVRIWRELIGGATQIQAEMRVHMPATALAGAAFRDLARDTFGTMAPFMEHEDWFGLVAAISEHADDVAVVPASGRGWVEALLAAAADDVGVIARVPMVAAPSGADGFVLGRASDEAGDGCRTLIALASKEAPDPAGLLPGGAELAPVADGAGTGGRLWLVSLDSAFETRALDALREREGDDGLAVRVLGRYPSPVE